MGTAYLAAASDALGWDSDLAAIADTEALLLGDAWLAVVALLRELPSAEIPTPFEVLDGLVAVVVPAVESWIRHIGFAYEDIPGGRYFHVLSPAKWFEAR